MSMQADAIDVVDTLRRVMDQVENDFASAHAEIVKLQGGDPDKFIWPEWSPQANTLRWFGTIRAALAVADSAGAAHRRALD